MSKFGYLELVTGYWRMFCVSPTPPERHDVWWLQGGQWRAFEGGQWVEIDVLKDFQKNPLTMGPGCEMG